MTAADTVSRPSAGLRLRPATADDLEPLVELRAVVMRADLERLGRYDPERVRQRLRDAYQPEHTSVVLAAGAFAGCVALRPAADGHWLEHFYLDPAVQGRGLGSAVLRTLLARADERGWTVRLNVLRGSPARRLYERFGFVAERADEVDVFMARRPGPGAGAGASEVGLVDLERAGTTAPVRLAPPGGLRA
ncbi:GNAT family N-acetyltransferase [Kitasatospora sp. NBC_01250]|uniref:GNAT family N-acetyltransferase n=1 Tax=Kitasatospora sp. NBC_01250 TaxID=2903571 RepID=UPI002E37DC41|nr:GNAT family N-acetyltransferase [Kitasatospora sp. NBC_01250]